MDKFMVFIGHIKRRSPKLIGLTDNKTKIYTFGTQSTVNKPKQTFFSDTYGNMQQQFLHTDQESKLHK